MLYLTKAERFQLEAAHHVFEAGGVSWFDRERLAATGADAAWLESVALAGKEAALGRQRVTLGRPIGTACRWQGVDQAGKPGTGTLYAHACPWQLA